MPEPSPTSRREPPSDDLVQLTIELAGSLDARTVMTRILERGLSVAGADRATLSGFDGDRLVIEASVGIGGEVTWVGRAYESEFLMRQPLVVELLATRRAVLGGGLATAAAMPEFRAALDNVKHTALVPILEAGSMAGMLVLSRYADDPFESADIPSLTGFGAVAGLALRNAKLYEQATATTRRLREAESTKRDFINIVVHELRGPLTAIDGYAELLEMGGAVKGAEAAGQLATIRRQAAYAKGLAEDLLILARLESDDLGVASEVVRLSDVAAAAVERALPRARLRGGDIELNASDDARARGDPELVGRVLGNLLTNAVAYAVDAPHVCVSVSSEAGRALVRVEDNGPGIPDDEQERIFARFARGSRALSVQGSGLGLYLSRECAQRMGGDLALESSTAETGSRFLLTLPAAF